MRKLVLLSLVALTFAACSTSGPKTAEINGKIDNLETKFALLISKGITDTITVNEDGTFAKKIVIDGPSYFSLRVARVSNTIFVMPNKKLTFNFDIKNVEAGPSYIGDLEKINNYLSKANKPFAEITKDFKGLYMLPKDEFTAKLDSVKIKITSLQKEMGVNNKTFIEFENARIDYRLKGMLFDYPSYNARFSGNEYTPNDEDYAFMKEVNLGNAKHFSIGEYTNLINKHIQQIHYKSVSDDANKGKSEFEYSVMLFDLIDSLVANVEIADYLKYLSTSETVKWESLEVSKNVSGHFIANAKTAVYREAIEKSFAKRMLLAPGQPAPDFTLTGIDGKEYSLKDFRGQLVYIDFWATWCGPCRREIPFLKKLKEDYAKKAITILGISLDDDKDAWVKMVNDEPLKGIQLHAEKAWNSDVAKNYQIYGIPTFVLIDAEGKIIEYPASRPSEPATKLTFDSYLKKK
jgi:thiol-disulfide isomerase/thioredoxin